MRANRYSSGYVAAFLEQLHASSDNCGFVDHAYKYLGVRLCSASSEESSPGADVAESGLPPSNTRGFTSDSA